MLSNKKTKFIMGAVVALCVLIASTIWVSLSIKSNAVDEFGYTKLANSDRAAANVTQIDRIIENSNGTNTSDIPNYDSSNYYISVIIPDGGAKATAEAEFGAFVASGGFADYVLDAYRTQRPMFNKSKMVIQYFTAGEANQDNLATADLIYVYAASAVSYTGGNAISEDLYEFLHAYAFGTNKPLIMDYPLKNSGSGNDINDPGIVGTNSRMFRLTSSDFKNSWKRCNTTNVSSWTKDSTQPAGTLIQEYMMSIRSTYVNYSLNNLTLPAGYASWTEYWQRTGTADPTLNILIIHGDGGVSAADATSFDDLAAWMVGPGKYNVFGDSLDANIPTATSIETVAGNTLTPDSFYVTKADGTKVQKYDYIFIAPNEYTAATDITEDVANELMTLSEQASPVTYILFGTLEGARQSGGGTGGSTNVPEDIVIDTTTNYGKLIDLSITTTGYAKKNNVLVIGTMFMQTIQADPAKNPTKCAKIANVINKGTYRTFAGSGSGGASGAVSTTAYRVLELQPCYPIDMYMALDNKIKTNVSQNTGYSAKGNYYTVPANVLNTDSIDDYANENGNIQTEYYQWDLSKAKLAYALAKSADEIELVQMSSEEFITAKANAADSYDLIYIGGNMSALKPYKAWNLYPNWYAEPRTVASTAAYSMYTHNGELAQITGAIATENPYQTTRLNGNDLTYDRYLALKNYMDAGMPIVFSNEVWQAYLSAKTDGYKNHYIDPDSNMYKVCAYADALAAKNSTAVLTDWAIKEKATAQSSIGVVPEDYYIMDNTTVTIENDGVYGTAAKVKVFNDRLSDQLYFVAYSDNTSIRPKYEIVTNAVTYSSKDLNTKLTDRALSWEINLLNPIAGHKYTAYLLIDQNDNAQYDLATEAVSSVDCSSGTTTLNYNYPEDDFGAISWQILVQDVTAATSAKAYPATSYSTISVIARSEDQDKKAARILEIMPMKTPQVGAQDGQDGHTLYLDSAYQQSRGMKFLYSNYFNLDGTINPNSMYGYCPTVKSSNGIASYYSSVDVEPSPNGMNFQNTAYLGKYMPSVSLNRYDSEENHEDWTYNYVDEIADDYDLTLDILYMEDVEYYAKMARTSTDEEKEVYLALAEQGKELYEKYITPGTVENTRIAKLEDDMRAVLTSIKDGNGFSYTGVNGATFRFASNEVNAYDFDGILSSREYYRYFFLNTKLYGAADDSWCQVDMAFHKGYYLPYAKERDKMIDAYRQYRHFNMLAYGPEEYLNENFDVVVVGFYDDFGNKFTDFSQDASDDLYSFIENDGSLLLTHDTMTKYMYSKEYSKTLTATLRETVGMKRFGQMEKLAGTENENIPHYVATEDKDRYFVTAYSKGANGENTSKNVADAATWNSSIATWLANRSGNLGKVALDGFSDVFIIKETNTAQAMPYTFAEFQIEQQIKYNLSYAPLQITGTTKATQVNRGVVTTYPYLIPSDLRISPTHNQAYALDLENDEITVWYTFAADSVSGNGTSGGNNYTTLKENSSIYAASPKDGMDSYFIYSYGNVTYCGAGHAMVTGQDRDNNDERKLFLNVLVNMAKRVKVKPKEVELVLFDPDCETRAPGKTILQDATNGYYMNVDGDAFYPIFGFGLDNLGNNKVTGIQMFYDLDYTATQDPDEAITCPTTGPAADKHVDIPLDQDKVLTKLREGILPLGTLVNDLNRGQGVYKTNEEDTPGLVTKQEYFDAYGGDHTYIVIRATITTEKGETKVVSQRLRLNLNRRLLDLN